MTLKEVKDNKTLRDFHELPFNIYKGDENWIPHLKQDVEKIFNPKTNKLWRNGEAVRWVMYHDAQPVGRIAAFVNRAHKEHPSGFGFFECVQNEAVAHRLLDTAKAWLQAQGMTQMDGPINFGENHQFWGLVIENFNESPYYGQNYNPEYYVKFFESYGLQIYFKQLVYHRLTSDPLQEKFAERAELLAQDPKYHVSQVSKKELDRYAADFRTIYNRAWANREEGFSEMSEAQARSVINSLKPVMDPKLMYFAYYENKPVGMALNLPEVNQIFRHVRGNLNWLGKLKFLWHLKRRTVNRAFGLAFGVDPDFQGIGVEGLIFKRMEEHLGKNPQYKDLVITWIGDFNPKMITIVESLGANKMRELATYRIHFDPGTEFRRKPIVNLQDE